MTLWAPQRFTSQAPITVSLVSSSGGVSGIGEKSLDEIRERLAARGMKLKE